MSLTLHLEDTLAQALRQEATEEQISAEELGTHLVREALQRRSAARRWRIQNRRRLELIAKKMNATLTADETDELCRLQTLANDLAAPYDQGLLETVLQLQREIAALPEANQP